MANSRWLPYLLGTFSIVTAIHFANEVRRHAVQQAQRTTFVQEGDCADGSRIAARIQFESGVAHLIRDNCTDLPVEKQKAVSVTRSPAGQTGPVYIYEGRAFAPEGP